MSSYFKQRHSFENRYKEALTAREKYPDRIPIICEKSIVGNNNAPNIDKIKYLVPLELTIGQFIYVIRKRMGLKPEEAIFLFIANIIPPSSVTVWELYCKYRDVDGFLYSQYSKENVFG